jgi:hypothetical protein
VLVSQFGFETNTDGNNAFLASSFAIGAVNLFAAIQHFAGFVGAATIFALQFVSTGVAISFHKNILYV